MFKVHQLLAMLLLVEIIQDRVIEFTSATVMIFHLVMADGSENVIEGTWLFSSCRAWHHILILSQFLQLLLHLMLRKAHLFMFGRAWKMAKHDIFERLFAE